ncbi:MAG: metalloregulator ArsR/SmtB family transcription factor [Pseudonocardiaceae bacterium]|nr:metalloregulator ArsR/SmtB family transcription factor [Pseudonocardiaceae bacterium]
MTDDEADRAAAAFKALSSPVRLRLLAALHAAPGSELRVCDFVDGAGLSQPTVSHHLAVLASAGLVRRERRGAWAWYTLVPERVEAARVALGQPRVLA